MPKVQVWVELSAAHLHGLEGEARRRGVPVEELVEQCVNQLVKDLEQEDDDDACPMVPS